MALSAMLSSGGMGSSMFDCGRSGQGLDGCEQSRMFGVLNVKKPVGLTSRDVVTRVQRLVRPHKAGHAGTLDPIASGVLIVCLGQATRLIEYAQQLPKSYRGTF